METRFFSFVWRYSKREQLVILAITISSFPLVYISLEIPKIIVNEAISGTDFPKDIFSFEVEQIPYLLLLCGLFLVLVVAINIMKWFMNVKVGMCGERMLRRLRFQLFEHVMRFPMRRFRTTKPGEVIQSMLGEIDPLGGFIGEVIATPAFQGGLLIVYCTFIFVQDVWLGLAAVSLYPIQMWLIPKLQARVIRLNKERAANTRKLADTLAESVNSVGEIHTNGTARWHLSQVSERLHTNTVIRLALFKRKYTIKFINNFLNQLTPFFFYSIGGYLVINGQIDFGSLVAVLAAYKDLAGPWKALLTYIQRWADFNSRYGFVIEQFMGDDIHARDRVYSREAPVTGDLEFRAVEGGPGTGGLTVPSLVLRTGETVALLGGATGAREAFIRFAAGLDMPAHGRVTLGRETLGDMTLSRLGASLARVTAEPVILSRSVRENVLYGLYRGAPDLDGSAGAAKADLLREATATGCIAADPMGDWVDYEAAGVEGAEALDDRLLTLVDEIGLGADLYSIALMRRLTLEDAARWGSVIMDARARLSERLGGLSDVVEAWDAASYNQNGSVLANVLFAAPTRPVDDIAEHLDDPGILKLLESSGAAELLLEVGREIAEEFALLVETVDRESPVLDGFTAYGRTEILAAAELHTLVTEKASTALKQPQKLQFMRLGARFVPVRDRLDAMPEDRQTRALAVRTGILASGYGEADVVRFDEERFSPGVSVGGNLLPGPRRFDRRGAWPRLEARTEEVISEAGLRPQLIRLGLSAPASTGLNAAARRRVALVRALLKRPHLVLLEGVASSETERSTELRNRIRATLPEAIVIYTAAGEDALDGADRVLDLDGPGGIAEKDRPRRSA